MLLGPAYKGIPLVTATSIALSEEHNINVPIAYNRKEQKAHGEGGVLVGSPLIGRVLVVDDVITAGTAIRETLRLIFDAKADLAGVAVGIDREERGIGDTSAVQEIEKDFKNAVKGIVKLPKNSKFAVYIAYRYYLKLLKKLKRVSSENIVKKRVRIHNFQKFAVIVRSYVKYQLNLIKWI